MKPFLSLVLSLLLAFVAIPRATFGQGGTSTIPEILESSSPNNPQQPIETKTPSVDFSKGPVPLWIWGENPSKKYVLTKEFVLESPMLAVCKFTCDNEVQLKINDKEVGRSSEWQTPVKKDVTSFLKSGRNVIRAEVANEGDIAGFAFKLILSPEIGQKTYVVSDDSWKAFESSNPTKIQNPKRIGKMGDGPWADIFANAQAPAGNQIFQLPPQFQIERLYSVPKETQGSWVCLCLDDKGRIIASDQENKGLYRITPGKTGTLEPTKVEKLKVKMSGAQGMLFAFGSLYVSANWAPGNGLYRLRDTDGDDQFDEVVKLKDLQGGGEHGPHSLRLSPDGKGILLSCGNHTQPPKGFQKSRLPSNWNEDHLLPRQWDANGHAVGVLAPGGYIARTDPEGKEWEILTMGYRNQFDFALHPEGELFVYDADMEWDFGMPWYRPTRVNHATSGSELGWRSGTGKWPAYYPDSLPAMIDIGPGSPVGVEFGTNAKFPAKYQKALFICDWTFGTMYALHLTPSGSTFIATKEEFVSRAPLPLTDVIIGKDGAMYFSVGGRGTQSELYRVTYVGKESTQPVDNTPDPMSEETKQRQLRNRLEAFHNKGVIIPEDYELILGNLGNPDRFIRYAARVALEQKPPEQWQEAVLQLKTPLAQIHGAIALAHQAGKECKSRAIAMLLQTDFQTLEESVRLDWLRALQLIFIRMGKPEMGDAQLVLAKLDPLFPASTDFVNRELIDLLVYLQSPTIAAKATLLFQKPSTISLDKSVKPLLARNQGYGGTFSQMLINPPDPQKIHYLFALRNLKDQWKIMDRKAYFMALNEERTKSGGASYQGFLNNIEKDAYENAKDTERLEIEAMGLRKPTPLKSLPKPEGPGMEWKLNDLETLAKGGFKGRNFANGKKAFASARCIVCHRFNGEGGATGPDLTQVAGRFSAKDLSESIVDPNKVISDQYRAVIVETKSGKLISGKIVSENPNSLLVLTDPEDSTKVIDIKKSDVEMVKPSPISLMPAKLIDSLNKNEVFDLLAYMLSKGDPNSTYFSK